ncbi:MAG: ABC transporter permease [Candidatus Aminicenantes bacterium]|nr:ABC transporter permease [Candidatus Aminicenantes bacterium]
MHGLLKLAWVEAKIYLRQPEAFFFTLVFPLLLLFLFGGIFGNKPHPLFGGRGTVDVSTPAYMALIIGSTGLISISIAVSGYREKGILRRYRATPLRPATILAAQVLVHYVMSLAGACLLVAAARLLFGLRFSGRMESVFAGFTLSCLSFFAAGFLLASLARNTRSAYILGMVIYFPNIFLSGATFPREIFPPVIRTISEALPITHVVSLLQGLWIGNPWSRHLTEVLVLVGILAAGVIISARVFRWE